MYINFITNYSSSQTNLRKTNTTPSKKVAFRGAETKFLKNSFNSLEAMTRTKPSEDILDLSMKSTSASKLALFKEKIKNKFNTTENSFPKIMDIIDSIISNPENKLGEGNFKIVYAIPEVDEFVIAKNKYIQRADGELKSIEATLPRFNFAEPVASNGSDIIIMDRMEGTSHSITDWTKSFRALISQGVKATTVDDSKQFHSNIKDIETFPVSSYIDLARRIKYLSDKDVRIDCVNPNNIVVDSQNKKFNVIDLSNSQHLYKDQKAPKNTVQDMIALLLDSLMHTQLLEDLDKKEQQEVIALSKNIINKCKIAGKIAGLENDNTNVIKMFKTVDDRARKANVSVNLYKKFVEIYKENLFD